MNKRKLAVIVLLGVIFGGLAYSLQAQVDKRNETFKPSSASGGSLKWKFQTGDRVNSSPALGPDGSVYFGSDDYYLYALNPDGSLKWKYKTGYYIKSSPALGLDGTVYFGSWDKYLYALNPDGSLKWKYKTGNEGSSPAIGEDGTIYVGSAYIYSDNYLYALNPDGTLKWRYQTGDYDCINSSPTIGSDGSVHFGSTGQYRYTINQDGSVYSSSGYQYLYALNPDGSLKWKYRSGGAVSSSPALGPDGSVYFGSSDGFLRALNPDGSLKWETYSSVGSSPALGPDGSVYFGSLDKYLYAFNPDGSLKWKYLTDFYIESSPALGQDGSVYFGSADDFLYALNPDGSLKWKYQTDKYVYSSPTLGPDGSVYIGSSDGYLYVLDSGTGAGLENSPWPKFRHDLQNTGRFTAIAGTYTLTGSIIYGSSGIPGVTVRLTGSGLDKNYTTGPNGNYSFYGLLNGTYTITPSKDGYSFTPASQQVTVNDGNVTVSSFVAPTAAAAGSLKWRYLTDGEVTTSPAIGSDGTIYVGSEDNNLYALNTNGTIKWSYSTGFYIDSSPAIGSDGTIYMGCWGKALYALNPNGTLKWSYKTGNNIYSSPAIGSDGTVYVGSVDYYLYALNPDGTLKWRYQTGDIVDSSPAVGSDGTVYVGSWDDYIYAINPDGTLRWRYQTGGDVKSSPAIDSDGTVYVGSWDHYIYALNPDGTLKWRYQTDFLVESSPSLGRDGTIYVGSDDDFLYALNHDGSLKWKYKTGDVGSSPAIGEDGTIYVGSAYGYVGSEDNYLYALNPDGTLKWRYQTGDYIKSSPTIGSDGTIYVGSDNNYLYALNSGTSSGLAASPWPKFHHDLRNTGSVQKAVVVPPVVLKVEPSLLYQESVDSVLAVTGKNFIQGALVKISGGGILVTRTDFIDSQHLLAKVSVSASAVPGRRDVSVVNPDGGTATGASLLEVKEFPAVFEVRPFYVEQGTDSLRVAINGKGFTQAVSAGFSETGINVLGLEYVGPNQLIALISVDKTAAPGRRELYLTVSGIQITFTSALEIKANLPPLITVAANWSVSEGEELSFMVDASDPEGGPVSYQTGQLPAGATFQGRSFTWRPGYDQAGSYSIRFTVTDKLGATAQANVNISILNRNRAPVFYKLDNQKTMAGTAMRFNITAGDPDRQRLELSHSGLPVGASISRVNDTTFTFNWTPSTENAGTFRTEFTVRDPEGASDRLGLALTVEVPEKAVNLPPVFMDTLSFAVDLEEGKSFELTIQAQDPNGDPVVVYARDLVQNAEFDPVTGRFTFRPDYTQSGSYSFLIVATDGSLSTSRQLTVRVKNTDIPPSILPLAAKEIFEGEQLKFVVAAVDSGGDALSYEASNLPRNASLNPLSGNFIFNPDYNQAGSYSIPVRVKDPAGNSAETVLSITVKNTNQSPRLTFIPNQFVRPGEKIELLITAVDPDGDSLSFDFQSTGLSDTLFNKQSQIFSFTAGAQPDSFQGLFIVSDPAGVADSQLVSFTVVPPYNRPPQIEQIAEQYYREGDTVRISVAAQDPDVDNLTFSIANALELPLAMRQISSQGKYEFIADYTLAGKYRVIIQVSDGRLFSAVEVLINIENVNRPPVLQPVGDNRVAEGETLSLTFSASDPDQDALSYDISFLPRGARFDKKIGRLDFTPDFDQADTLYVGLSVSDGQASTSENFRLVVTNTNRPPKVRRVKDPAIAQGELMEFEMEADDPDGDSAWVVIDSLNVPFLTGSMKGMASIRNRRSFFFDTAKLIQILQQIPSAFLKFYAVDKYGARSEEEIVDLAVIRKALEKIKDLPPGLEKKLGFLDNYGVGVQVAIKNNSDKTISGDIETSERSGRLKPVLRGQESEMLLSSIMAQEGKKREESYQYIYLSAGGEEKAFYGIRRGWGLDIRRGWGWDISLLKSLTEVNVVFSYTEQDLPLELEGFSESNLCLYGLDSLTGWFIKIANAVVNTDSNTVTFKLTNWNIVDYTLGVDISPSAGDLQTLTIQMVVDNVPLTTNRTTNITGPYQIRAFAPDGSLVSIARLFYRLDSTGEYLSKPMNKIPGERYGYMAELDGLSTGGKIQYYVEMFVNYELVDSPLSPDAETHQLIVLSVAPGDVSGDGVLNIFDLLDLLKILSGKLEPNLASDCDQNGKVDIFDLLALLRLLK